MIKLEDDLSKSGISACKCHTQEQMQDNQNTLKCKSLQLLLNDSYRIIFKKKTHLLFS